MLKKTLTLATIALCFAAAPVSTAFAQMPDPPGQVQKGEKAVNEAYLFAHMMKADYWHLYYSVSLDGLHWEQLNDGKRIYDAYRGHPDITKGHDGRYYIVGNDGDPQPDIHFWVSDDLIKWEPYSTYTPDLKSIPDYPTVLPFIGAPKMYFDQPSKQYIVTWHTTHDLGKTDLPEPHWAGQRTIYALSKDLKTFSEPPKKLFPNWDPTMATIDVSIRQIGDSYYAIIKDERYPTEDWTTGKTIRIAKGKSLTGPFDPPGDPISPSFREAPMLIPSPNAKAWYLYYEQYPAVSYGLSVTTDMDGKWFQIAGVQRPDWDKYTVTKEARHGCMLPISREQYDALVKHFGKAKKE